MKFILIMSSIWIMFFLMSEIAYFIVLGIYVIWSLSLTKIFLKAEFSKWKSFVPIYNILLVIQLAKLPNYYIFGVLLPLFNSVGWLAAYMFLIYISVALAQQFGKTSDFLMNVVMFPPICMYKMGVDNSIYIKGQKRNKL